MILAGIGLWFVALFIGGMVILPIRLILESIANGGQGLPLILIIFGGLWCGVFALFAFG